MQDKIYFHNLIKYMVVSPSGDIESSGVLKNAVGARVKDQILLAMTGNQGANPGTLTSANIMGFRLDGSAILGSFAQWNQDATAYSTRYNSATYLNSVGFNGTYQATANVTCRAVILQNYITYENASDVGSYAMFYSTNLNMSVGSAGKIIINWTISV